ncbi:MAG: hypothetical protein ABIH85_08725 [Candidatus Omnitrophota bacterium]
MSEKNKIVYEFENVGTGDEDGFNDPVRTAFDTNISRTVARESIQNILDAGMTEPARAEFSLSEEDINTALLDLADIRRIMKSCQKQFPDNPLCVEHFKNILQLINKPKIRVLKISDYNTKGLSGDDNDRNEPYYCFLKSIGASSKSGQEGGSFGLGKGSFYAASALNTIIVSSAYEEEGQKKHVFQGKLRLVSHLGIDDQFKRGNGSLGLIGEKPVRDYNDIPDFYKRDETGTDLYIMGYRDADDWKYHIVRSILNSFWYSIMKNRLVVKIEDIEINEDTLRELIYQYFQEDTSHADNPLIYYETLETGTSYVEQLPTLGEVTLYLKKGTRKHNKVACFRKTGMLIQEKMFVSPVPYSGVFICENDTGNRIFRDMESPNHDKWDVNSAHSKITSEPKPDISKADREYKNFIKKKIRELIDFDNKKEMTIGGLEKYLFLSTEDELENENVSGVGSSSDISDEETPVEVGVSDESRNKEVKSDPVVTLSRKVEKGAPDSSPGTDSRGPGKEEKGGGAGKGGGGTPEGQSGGADTNEAKKPIRKILDVKSRSFVSQSNSGKQVEHMLIIRDGIPGKKCAVKVIAGTDDSFDENITIKSASIVGGPECKISGANQIEEVSLDDNGETKIQLEFDSNDKYSLKVVVYEDE